MFGWEFPPHISGGLGTACYGLTKALAGFNDIEVTFVVPKLWGDEDKTHVNLLGADQVQVVQKQIHFNNRESKIDYYELHSGLIPYLGTSEFYELKTRLDSDEKKLIETTSEGKILFGGDYGHNLFQEIQSYAIVAEKLAQLLDFDVIHVHDWMTFPAGIAAKQISGKPLVVQIHSTEFDRSGNQINPMIYNAEKAGMDAADQIIAVSNFTRNIIVRNYYIEPKKVLTVYNAVEPFDIKPKNEARNIKEEKIVLFLGRITSQKGPGYFIDAAELVLQKMKNVRFVMAGKGDLRDQMISRTTELNISEYFSFPGFIEDEEVHQLLASADVFVMPSVSEPFGIVALEAMHAQVPVIVSRQSGASEVLRNIVKVDYWNIQKMADAIVELLSDTELKNKMVEKGKKEVEQLIWKKSASDIRKMYRRLNK
jgi:glycosyltransferase involved in cell wall biosynthesis